MIWLHGYLMLYCVYEKAYFGFLVFLTLTFGRGVHRSIGSVLSIKIKLN